MHGSASTAWLAYAETQVGETRELACVEAAREALAGGHEVGAIAIAKIAENEGFGERLAPLASEARARLGLATTDLGSVDTKTNLQRGTKLLEQRSYDEAVAALRLAYGKRDRLSPEDRVQLAMSFARALDRSGAKDDAIEILRTMVADMPLRSDRDRIYKLASTLYEDRLMYAQAIEALQGRL